MKTTAELFLELCKMQLQGFQNMNSPPVLLAEPEGNNIFSTPGDGGWGSLGNQEPNQSADGDLRASLLAVNDAVAELQRRFINNQHTQERLSKLVNRLVDIIDGGDEPPPDEADFKEPEKKEGAA